MFAGGLFGALPGGGAVAADKADRAEGGALPAEADVLVYGATPGGIGAALAAAKHGHSVLLVEPTHRIGGMLTCGLSHADFRTFEALGGTFRDFADRVERHYRDKYGPDSPEARCWRGTHAEPHVNLLVLEAMLAERPSIRVAKRTVLAGVEVGEFVEGRRPIRSVRLRGDDGNGEPVTVRARLFIDATYEGDLLAPAGESYHVGREARGQYGEPLAGDERGDADGQVQGYSYRLIMTDRPGNRVPAPAPPGYRREDFIGVLPFLTGGKVKSVFGPKDAIYKLQFPPLPNGKSDVNDMSNGPVRLSMPDVNDAYPDGDAATRKRIVDRHLAHNIGLLHFLQNDPEVPEAMREDARKWGLCKDEFADTGHIPPQLYIREARRLVGQYVYTQRDTDQAPDDARARRHADSIGISDYILNCHGTGRTGTRFEGKHTGEFYKWVQPSQIPYGVIVPAKTTNLLVPVAVSASHVGFSMLRYEYVWMNLGQAAGHAAHLSLSQGRPVHRVDVAGLQDLLHADRGITVYVSDVPPGSPDFAPVQWAGNRGFLHGLHDPKGQPPPRPKSLGGQYFEAFPHHAAELDAPLTAELEARWRKLAEGYGITLPPASEYAGKKRGDLLRDIHSLGRAGKSG
jgi:hypothetical protein